MQFLTDTLYEPGGRVRNEDAHHHVYLDNGACCWIVADGLGGHGGGDVASKTAVEGFITDFTTTDLPLTTDQLQNHLQAAHEAILAKKKRDSDLQDMRTTVVALVSDGINALWIHVGDSRLYVIRNGILSVLTSDHSVPQALVNAGDIRPQDIRYHIDRNRLLRDVGGDKPVKPTLCSKPWSLQDGDIFLLCTDGFWELVTETAMLADLAKSDSPESWLNTMERRLKITAEAKYHNRHDNYTATAIFVVDEQNPLNPT